MFVRDFSNAAENIAVIGIQAAAAFHGEHLVNAGAVSITGQKLIAGVAFFNHLIPGIVHEIGGDSIDHLSFGVQSCAKAPSKKDCLSVLNCFMDSMNFYQAGSILQKFILSHPEG